MIYWIVFFLLAAVLLISYSNSVTDKSKIICKWLLILLCTYFSAFRDGLGTDYEQYLYRLEVADADINALTLISEPVFAIMAAFINNTRFSPVFFFAFMSVVTIVPISLLLFKNYKPEWSMFIFIAFVGCGYMQSFNVVRQFAAVSLVFVAIEFLLRKDYQKFAVFIIIGTLFHRSAIFMLLLPLLNYVDLQRKLFAIFCLFVTFFINWFNIGVLSRIKIDIQAFENSNADGVTHSASTIFVFLNLISLYIICTNNRLINYNRDKLIYTMGLFCVYIYNLSVTNIIFSRMALYLAPPLYILLTFPMRNQKVRYPYQIILASIFVFLLIKLFINSNNTSSIIPEQILPISSIFD